MINREIGIYFNPDVSGKTGEHAPRRKRREAQVKDYLLKVPITEFAQPIPLPPDTHLPQPGDLMKLVLPHVPFNEMRNHEMYAVLPDAVDSFRHDFELVLVGEDETDSQLAVQMSTKTVLSRGILPASVQEELRQEIKTQFPEEYTRLVANIQPIQDSRREPVWWDTMIDIHESITDNEGFDIIKHASSQTTSGSIRIEEHEASEYIFMDTVTSDRSTTTTPTSLYEERLVPHIYTCTPVIEGSEEFIEINAHIPWIGFERTGDKMIDVKFIFERDGFAVPNEEIDKMLAKLEEEDRDIVAERQVDTNIKEYIVRRLKGTWHHVCYKLRRREEYYNGPGKYKEFSGEYVLKAFGQNIDLGKENSLRVFDASFIEPTVRDATDVAQEIYMTDKEIAKADRKQQKEDNKVKDWWFNTVIPRCKDWDKAKIAQETKFLKDNAQNPIALMEEKLRGSTRLIILGLTRHPLQDNLTARMLTELPNLDFVALETREPTDKTLALKEELLTQVDMGDGVVMEMPVEMARKKYPDKYRDPNKPTHILDSLIAKARLKHLDIINALTGDTYKKNIEGIGARISEYMTSHPDAKGILFTNLLQSIKWPGYKTEAEKRAIGFHRPFVDMYSLANAHYSDTKIRMPAYTLHANFPGQVYNLAQFEMPKGYGYEWKNLRAASAALGTREPFAIDNIVCSSFAQQWSIVKCLAELENWPVEELWQVAGPFCGPTMIDWGKLIDGIIIYPSDKPLTKPLASKQLMEKAGEVIADLLKDQQI